MSIKRSRSDNLSAKAPLASPTFTGIPASTTASVDTSTTQIATTAYVVGQAASATSPINGTAATGTSLRYARQDHVHASDTSRAPLASPTFTGVPLSTTAAADTNTTQIATTAYVVGQAASATSPIIGTAAIGTSLKYARQDHVHAVLSPTGAGSQGARLITMSTSAATGGADGDVWLVYV